MRATSTVKVMPIEGWGWVDAGAPRLALPRPFTVQLEHVEAKRWRGFVLDGGHEFEGRQVGLSQRHNEWTGHVNIAIEPLNPGGKTSFGFGMLSVLPSAEEGLIQHMS